MFFFVSNIVHELFRTEFFYYHVQSIIITESRVHGFSNKLLCNFQIVYTLLNLYISNTFKIIKNRTYVSLTKYWLLQIYISIQKLNGLHLTYDIAFHILMFDYKYILSLSYVLALVHFLLYRLILSFKSIFIISCPLLVHSALQ